jgi:3',5'-cyclic AMP phosphodiesterase CpdA
VTVQSAETPAATLRARLVLVGDAGQASRALIDEVAAWAARDPSKTHVVYVGDNMYPKGMTADRRHEGDVRLLPLIEAATRHGARVLFVPGNHDWADGGREGHTAILAQAAYVTARVPYAEAFLPSGGCPGPAVVDAIDGIRIVALDTQWWLHEHHRPTSACVPDPDQVLALLGDSLNTDRHVIIAAHHPPIGHGRHAGFSNWTEYLLPPVVGAAVAISRKFPLRIQDYTARRYRAMIKAFDAVLAGRRRPDRLLVWVAGHEHSLQVLEGRSVDYVLISGAATYAQAVTHGPETIFAQSRHGFMVIDLVDSGRALLRVVASPGETVFSSWLEPRAGNPPTPAP